MELDYRRQDRGMGIRANSFQMEKEMWVGTERRMRAWQNQCEF